MLPDLASDTDLCVKCGLCLPHCPTYTKTLDENESPRGRLALIQAVARGELKPTPELVGHVDHCLLCRSCEAVCPAYVPYSRIIDRFRQETRGIGKGLAGRLRSATLRQALTGPASRLLEAPAAVALRNRALAGGIPRLVGLGGIADGIPQAPRAPNPRGTHPAGDGTRSAALFLGCTANLLDAATVGAAIRLMNRLGVTVQVPESQTCCGALHWHGGERTAAVELMAENLAAFEGTEGEAVVSFASGCAAMLRDYREVLASPEAERFAGRIRDISQFLAELPWPAELELRPLPAVVALHAPCTLRNVLRADGYAQRLLQRIPELEIAPLPTQASCCGAAGSYMLEHPQMAGALRDDLLDRVLAVRPACLVTSNPGCAMHLRAGLQQRGRADIEVLHPVVLLARQLGN